VKKLILGVLFLLVLNGCTSIKKTLGLNVGKWMITQNGCKVWNSNPLGNETGTWSGKCVNGYIDGFGTFQWYLNGKKGQKTIGSYKNGYLQGLSKVFFKDVNGKLITVEQGFRIKNILYNGVSYDVKTNKATTYSNGKHINSSKKYFIKDLLSEKLEPPMDEDKSFYLVQELYHRYTKNFYTTYGKFYVRNCGTEDAVVVKLTRFRDFFGNFHVKKETDKGKLLSNFKKVCTLDNKLALEYIMGSFGYSTPYKPIEIYAIDGDMFELKKDSYSDIKEYESTLDKAIGYMVMSGVKAYKEATPPPSTHLRISVQEGGIIYSTVKKFTIEVTGDSTSGYKKKDSSGNGFFQLGYTEFFVPQGENYTIHAYGINGYGKEVFGVKSSVRIGNNIETDCSIKIKENKIECINR